MITFEEVQAFVLLVTGHPRQWYAAWQYDSIIENVMTSADVDVREAQEAINDAYAARCLDCYKRSLDLASLPTFDGN